MIQTMKTTTFESMPNIPKDSTALNYTPSRPRTELEREKSTTRKRKGDTDHHNYDFEVSQKTRNQSGPKNFKTSNCRNIKSLNSGRPLQERLVIPDEAPVYGYGGQKLSIWEF